MKNMRIVVSGTVGIGKTTTAKILEERLSLTNDDVFLNNEIIEGENPYLDSYYENRPEWSFLTQMSFLNDRFRAILEEEEKRKKNPNRISIFDRHFLDDYIFANLKTVKWDMSAFQWNSYDLVNKYFANSLEAEMHPDYFFLLKTSLQTVLKRIEERNRGSEAAVDVEYWENMYYHYYEDPKIIEYLKENTKRLIVLEVGDLTPDEITDEIIKILNKDD